MFLELDKTTSFSQYLINDDTLDRLKKQRGTLRSEIKKANTFFKFYTLEEKEKALALLENYLDANVSDCSEELLKLKQEAKNLKDEIRRLQNNDDQGKINDLSNYITELYKSASNNDENKEFFVNEDLKEKGFKIRYIKRGNILQPTRKEEFLYNGKKEIKSVNYCPGSLARHTLIQLCGYFGFLKMLLGKYPLIPILVIDHVSKPFDETNIKLLGPVITKAIDDIGKDKLQIFLFDDEDCNDLDLIPDHYEDLIKTGENETPDKTGFVPFFFSKKQ